jgi:uncharacterized SAM-binding protein YcdF (DUF218 family)
MYAESMKKHSTYDAIIVPGIPFVGPRWDTVMQMRVLWAAHLYKRGIAKNIITSGNSVYSPYVEGKIMKLYLIELGVPEKHIFVEDKAEHSTENVWYSNKIAKAHGFKTVAVATDEFQTKMIYRFMKKRTPEISRLPVLIDTLRTLDHTMPKIEYEDLKVKDFVSLPDRESGWQRLRGTKGKHINFKEK